MASVPQRNPASREAGLVPSVGRIEMELQHNAYLIRRSCQSLELCRHKPIKVTTLDEKSRESIPSVPALETTLSHRGSIFEEVLATVHGGANNIVNFGTNLIG